MADILRVELRNGASLRDRRFADNLFRSIAVTADERGLWWSLATTDIGEAWRVVVREMPASVACGECGASRPCGLPENHPDDCEARAN